ncbi:MAG: translocation/assembly module TamB domain-containing protein [Bacteroidales bacterium]|nr:translocation/assembly module TamB domain-containing protein [Candidatus Physcousia equi]
MSTDPLSNDKKKREKRSLARRIMRWACWLVLSPILLFLFFALLLYIPFVQDWAVGYACRELSASTGMKVEVERVRLKFPLDIDLQQLCVTQRDTLLAVESCVLDLDLCGILGGKIGVDAFDLNGGYVDSHDLIATLKIKGRIQDFHLDVHDLEWSNECVNITGVQLDGCDLDLALQDTTVVDTTESTPLLWKLNFADVEVNDTRVAFHTPGDTMSVAAAVERLALTDGSFDLGQGKLRVSKLDFAIDSLHYNQNHQPRAPGLDVNHLALYDLALQLPQVDYDLEAGHLRTRLEGLRLRERSGLTVEQLCAGVELDDNHLVVEDAQLRTPTSALTADAQIEWAALEAGGKGRLNVQLRSSLSRDDLFALTAAYLPEEVKDYYPKEVADVTIDISGNMDKVEVEAFSIDLPGMMQAEVRGGAGKLLSDGQLVADLDWSITTQDMSLIRRLAGIDAIKLPPMVINGTTAIRGDLYHADLLLKQGNGRLKLNGDFDVKRTAYHADLDVCDLAVHRFLPLDSACVVTTRAKVQGMGFDIFAPKARLHAMLDVPSATYGKTPVGDIRLDAQLNRGVASMNFYSANALLDADGCFDVQLQRHEVDSASFDFDLRRLDFYRLGVTKKPFAVSMAMHMLGQSNLSDHHFVKGDVSAIVLHTKDSTLYPRDINLEALLRPDTTFAFLSAGDLMLHLQAPDGVGRLLAQATVLNDTLVGQMGRHEYNDSAIRRVMPTIGLTLESGRRNPLHNIVSTMGYTYNALRFDLHASPEKGAFGEGYVHTTNTGSIVIDTIAFDLKQVDGGLELLARVANGKKNKDVTFDAQLAAHLNPRLATASLVFNDAKGRKGVDLGAKLHFLEDGMMLHLEPLRPVLAYRFFTLNDSNYVYLKNDGRILADLDLLADDGTGLKLFSTANEDALQDLTASLNHFNLGEICAVIPYMPSIGGLLHGDVHYQQAEESTSIMADLEVQRMVFEGAPMGDIGLNAAYMPNADGSHFVDGYITHDRRQTITFNGSYEELGKTDRIDAQATLSQFPLNLLNGFLGETLDLAGSIDGDLGVKGSTKQPLVDGFLRTDSMHIKAPLYSFDMRVVDDSLQFNASRLNLNELVGYTMGKTPLVLDGVIDFHELSNITLDVTARARNFELINAKKDRHADAYGKVYVNLDAHAKGATQRMDVTGRLSVLGSTDVTYVLRDSPINVDDEMSDLVTFCDFSDTLEVEQMEFAPPSNVNLVLNVDIDQSARINCLLSDDGANYVKLEGGGNFKMLSDDVNGMSLFGRYNILDGKMTYNVVVVSLKDCVIKNGSYVEFNGDIGNPRLNLKASQRVNTSVTNADGNTRGVAFDVGVSITNTLNNMGLDFTIEAPEDLTIYSELAQMSPAERSRTAVALMATGTYLSTSNKRSGFSADGAINNFLQGQINGLTSKTLKNVDLSLGVQNKHNQTGSTTTDYSFKFAKRFWGNRVSVIVGGKVSSGAEAQNNGQSIIDNVSVEYRLDKSATRYVTLYYTDDNTNILEGKVRVMGAGLVLRRKTNRLGELFLFRKIEE